MIKIEFTASTPQEAFEDLAVAALSLLNDERLAAKAAQTYNAGSGWTDKPTVEQEPVDPVAQEAPAPDPVPAPAVSDPVVPDPVVPDPVVPDPAVPDPAVPDPVAPASVSTYAKGTVRAAMVKFAQTHSTQAAKALLQKHGADNFTALPMDRYDAFMADLQAAGGSADA